MHSHHYEHTYANPITVSTFEGLNLEIPEVTIGASLSTDAS
jgi:hypothetical protein